MKNLSASSSNFTAQEPFEVTCFRTSLLFCNLLIGVPTHSYVLWLIARERRIPSEFFNVNLIVCEIMYSLIALFNICQILPILQTFLQGLGITGRPLFHCLMCVERYLAVVHPVIFLKTKPLRYKVICCVLVWIVTLGSCFGVMFVSLNKISSYAWLISVQFLVFFFIQMFCLVSVLRALKQSGPGERRKDREDENHMKRRAFHLILITTITLVVMFAPFLSTGFFTALEPKAHKDVAVIWVFCLSCFIFAGFVQPVLYLHRAGKLLCCKFLIKQ